MKLNLPLIGSLLLPFLVKDSQFGPQNHFSAGAEAERYPGAFVVIAWQSPFSCQWFFS
jgi:hypothetical protein